MDCSRHIFKVLRNLVREELRKFKQVSHFEAEHAEHADRGGPGITLITILVNKGGEG